jgi:hypothetical protein
LTARMLTTLYMEVYNIYIYIWIFNQLNLIILIDHSL